MHEALLLLAALLANLAGALWLALSLEAHWEQVRGNELGSGRAALLRALGGLSLLAGLLLCLRADHATMAALVWFMALVASALGVAFTLAWRPRLLRPLAAWLPPRPAVSA